MKILQLGKFFPIKGGVEKVEYDLMRGLSEHGIDCDMLCASARKSEQQINGHAKLIFCRTWIMINRSFLQVPLFSFVADLRKNIFVHSKTS